MGKDSSMMNRKFYLCPFVPLRIQIPQGQMNLFDKSFRHANKSDAIAATLAGAI
jgi:hypothetical protein